MRPQGKPEAVRQPQSFSLLKTERTERIIRTTKTINLLVANANQHNPTGLTQDKGTGDRIGILGFIKENGVLLTRKIWAGNLKKLQINIIRDREIRFGTTHLIPENLYGPPNFICREAITLILYRQMDNVGFPGNGANLLI